MFKKNVLFCLLILSISSIAFISCDKDDNDDDSLKLSFSGLEDLGDNYAYEGWIIVDGSPVSTGVFTVDENGRMSKSSFDVSKDDLDNASTFVLTIEPSPDNDPAPSHVHILGGDFSGSSADLSVSHSAALGTDFASAAGQFILATPTNGAMNNEESGIWWLDPSGPSATLTLPTLPNGWKYEGWVVVDGTPLTSGTFTSVSGADDAAPYSGSMPGPPFPGEDYVANAPSGVTFPADLRGGTAVISVEPDPDNSAAPFLLKPLVGTIDASAPVHTLLGMNNNAAATNPSGRASF